MCHDLIAYLATLTSPKINQLGLIFRTGGSIIYYLEGSIKKCCSTIPNVRKVDSCQLSSPFPKQVYLLCSVLSDDRWS